MSSGSKTTKGSSRKRKTSKKQEEAAAAVSEVAIDTKPVEEPKEEKAPPAEPKKAAKKEPKMSLEDACRRFVVGYKSHWYPSIDRFAKTQGYQGPTTEAECKRFLTQWGANLK
jgi:hypothetical protein